jgi:hypothetical protein
MLSFKGFVLSEASDNKKAAAFRQLHDAVKNGNPDATDKDIARSVNHRDPGIRLNAAEHPRTTSKQLSKLITARPGPDAKEPDHSHYATIASAAVKNPSATAEHISQALDHPDPHVRYDAITSKKATQEHITKALNDPVKFVRQAAMDRAK